MRNPLAHIPTGRAAAAMANGLPVVYPNTLSTTPRGGDSRPSLFLRLIAWLLIATISTSSFAQAVGPILRGANGQPLTGFAKNGTFMQAGQVVGNPHQIQHDQQNPDLWSTGAVALSHDNAVQPLYVQPTVDQMMATIAPPVDPGGLYLSRLYLNPTNPYVAGAGPLSYPPSPTPETGSAAPTSGPLIDNFEQYRRAYVHALAQITGGNAGGGWKETLPSDAGVVYLAKSHVDSSPELKNFAWDAFPNKPVFQAAEDPKGGATAVFAIQGSLAKTHLANLQLQNASLLGSQIFFTQQTIKTPTNWSPGNEWGSGGSGSGGGDWGSNSALSAFEAQLGSAPLSGNSNHGNNSYGGALHNANGFEIGYIQTDGQAHAFDITSDQHFRQFQSSASSGTGNNNSLLGANLRTAGIQNQKGQDAIANIGFDWAKDDKALFYQGVNLYNYGNKADNALLRQLELGQITPGSTDYARARALAEQRFTQAYQASVEYELKKKFTKEGAKYQAAQLSFDDFDAGKLFNSGLNLFDKKGDPEQERLLGELKAGNLKPGDARYAEIRGLAEARYRVAYQKALEPPKKPNPLKQLVAVVVAAVVTYFTAGAATGWAATALGTTAGATTVSGIAATAIGSAVGSYAGTVISAGIQTGSMSKALAAGENSLKGGLANIVVSTALAATGLNGGNIGTALGMSDKVGQAVLNTMTTSLSQTMAYGGSLGDTLISSAINNGVNVISADIANQIGQANLNGLDGFSTEFAHGALGCASAVARGGNSDSCGAGAVGAVVAHAGGSYVDQSTGRVLSDSELSFYSSLGGGVAAALVGGSNNVQTNFNTGQVTGQNAVDNNLLTTRALKDALDRIEKCTSGCEVLKKALQRDTQQGGEQLTVGNNIVDRCKANPQGCLGSVQDMAAALKELQNPETRALLGDAGTNALIARQSSDLGKAVEALQWGADHLESSQAIVRAAVGVGLTVAGGGLALSLGRAAITACGSGLASPACVSLSTELAVGAMETAGGVPTAGLTAASLTATASQLAKTAATATDAAQVVRQVQLTQMEVVIARETQQLASGQVLTRYMGVDIPSSLPPPAAGWGYSPDLVTRAKTDAAAFAHMTGFQGEVRVAADAANRGEMVVSWGGKVGTQGADVISVTSKGEVILYDAKTYSNATNVKPTTTFAPGSDALANARQQALDAVEASNLPPALKQQAFDNIEAGNFTTRTTNQGVGGSSPVSVKFCGGAVCP